ncbi:MAG: hypothetical protein KZQ93_08040 [Candidatus Thiodiazotropha sp. (ex Monitilora ramsayi)]|nr:hypothetical protein [Candidatus Thiodiazotropha sp. (ex Monitilora ramsayi)]
MKQLITAAIELCLLRLGPQDLPASQSLLLVSLVLNFIIGMLMVVGLQADLGKAFLETLFQILLMLGTLYLALKISKRLSRFNQSASALMLSGLLLGLMALPLVLWNQRSQSTESGLLILVLLFWSIVVLGHILRHTFEMPFNIGIAAAMIYTLLSWNLTALVFPVTL